eukprot:scaffold42707_cov139-Skeletonema_dohrnii-CCMP3373.AAC.2
MHERAKCADVIKTILCCNLKHNEQPLNHTSKRVRTKGKMHQQRRKRTTPGIPKWSPTVLSTNLSQQCFTSLSDVSGAVTWTYYGRPAEKKQKGFSLLEKTN